MIRKQDDTQTSSKRWTLGHWLTASLSMVGVASAATGGHRHDRDDFARLDSASSHARKLLASEHGAHRRARPAVLAPPRVEVVVAHHNENLQWLQGHENIARIYHKSQDATDLQSSEGDWLWRERLDNVGMESHTYLSHISQRYNQLADITLFTQGSIEATVDNFAGLGPMLEQAFAPSSEMVIWRSPSVFRRWDGMIHTSKWLDEYNSGKMRRSGMTPGEFWHFVFGPSADAPPGPVNYAHEATFAVQRDAIVRHPREFYDRILSYFEALNHTRPEEGHYMERLWMPMFGTERQGVVLMPAGLRIPVFPPNDQVTFPDHATDGVWHG